MAFETKVGGSPAKDAVGERNNPSVRSRMYTAMRGMSTTYGPTPLHHMSLDIAQEEFAGIKTKLEKLANEAVPALEEAVRKAGAPWIEGQPLPTIGPKN